MNITHWRTRASTGLLRCWLWSIRSSVVPHHPPHHVCQVIRHEQRTSRVDGHAHRTTPRGTVVVAKTADKFDRVARRSAIGERHEHHAVPHWLGTIPAAMLTHKRTLCELLAHLGN